MEIMIRRVYDDPADGEDVRVLVDRLWPRGVKKTDLDAEWDKDLAPSDDLRSWFHEDVEQRWSEFAERYRHELDRSGAVAQFLDDHHDAKAITLLFASKDPDHNHALVLQRAFEDFADSL